MRADNSHHVVAAAARRKAQARQRVLDVLQSARSDGLALSPSQVAAAATVSRAYLYSQPDLLSAVRELCASNAGRPAGINTGQRATPASLLTRIEALTARNRELRQNNRELRRRLELAYGQLREAERTRA
ncbi:DUF6262 family protein [Kineococcus sp. SYSU DK018]|uniref:DUF6262 family protein n=1 Tax=Kineococcus sp. SYSU DK018 TaxID=3383139 RepID=UPI003D7E48A4